VVAALKLKLLPGQAPGLGEARTGSTDAYLAYLEGRKLLAEAGSILRFNLARGPEALARRAADLHVFEDDSDHNTLVTSASPVAAVERFLGG
jgi:hypothetical protein